MRHGASNRLFWPALAAALAAPACFNPPAAAVQFSCEPAGADACPAGYSCRADGCCHKEGTEVDGAGGECKLGGGDTGGPTSGATLVTTTGATTSTTDATTSTAATDTGATTSGATDTGATTSGTASSTGGTQSTGA